MADTDRYGILLKVKEWQFTRLMDAHGCRGEATYYLTEMMVFWPDIGYDQEHCWLLN
jgi:hypothetical protein